MAAPLEVADRIVADIRLDLFVELVGRFFELPVLNSRRFASDEILKIDRLIFRPDAARAAKVGHARFRANARAGEEYNLAGPSKFSREFFQPHVDSRQLRAPSLLSPVTGRCKRGSAGIIWSARVELVLPAAAVL